MENKLKYIYIEDTKDPTTESFRVALECSKKIEVELVSVLPFEEQIQYIFDRNDVHGIILDLKLDENPNDRDIAVRYTAPALAQALRSKYTELAHDGNKMDIPIILFSTDEKITNSYHFDSASHDLFDFRMSKSDTKKNKKIYSDRLFSIANGYIEINQLAHLDFNELLKFDISLLDSRIFDGIQGKTILPAFEYAKKILRDLIFYDSPLINESILAARLGVDINSGTWESVKEIFANAKYKGIFSDVWERWWMPVVHEIFSELSEGQTLSTLTAQNRVSFLQRIISQEIVPATPIQMSTSSRFWTICKCFQKPLDPTDGFRILRYNHAKPWLDNQYISLKAALDRAHIGHYELEEIENERLEIIKHELE